MTSDLSRRRLLSTLAAGFGALAGCGYRPGGGDVRWRFSTATGSYGPDYLLAGDGLLFGVTRSATFIDFDSAEQVFQGIVTVWDAKSGSVHSETETVPPGRPAIRGDSLFVGDRDGTLSAFDPDGTRRWQVSLGGFPSEVAVADGRVYALVTSEAPEDSVEFDSIALVAVTAKGGELLWGRSLDSDADYGIVASPDGVYARRFPDREHMSVVAFSPTGQVRWRVDRPAGSVFGDDRPTVGDDALYVPTDGELLALATDDGSERWTAPVEGIHGSPAIADGTVYQSGDALSALRARDGKRRWTFGRGDGEWITTGPTVAGDSVYVGSEESVSALGAGDGSVRWRVESEEVTDSPVVVGETVVVRTRDGTVRGHWRG